MKDKLTFILKLLVGLGLIGFFFYLFLSDPETRQTLLGSFVQANFWYWGLAVILFILAVASQALKWQILLKAQGVEISLWAVIHYTFVGTFFTNFLPSNVGGDVMRGYGLARYTERNADAAVSVVVDRVIGLIAFMFTGVLAAFAAVQLASSGRASGSLAGNDILVRNLIQVEIIASLVMLGIVVTFGIMLSQRLRLLVGQLFKLKLLHSLSPIYEQLSNAFGAYRRQYRALLFAFLVGLANPLLTGMVDIAILAGLNQHVNPLYIFLFNPIIATLLIVPISIGGLGTQQALYIYFYGLVGIPATTSFALSVVKQLVIYLGSMPGALFWLGRQKRQTEASVAAAQADS